MTVARLPSQRRHKILMRMMYISLTRQHGSTWSDSTSILLRMNKWNNIWIHYQGTKIWKMLLRSGVKGVWPFASHLVMKVVQLQLYTVTVTNRGCARPSLGSWTTAYHQVTRLLAQMDDPSKKKTWRTSLPPIRRPLTHFFRQRTFHRFSRSV